MAREKSHQRRNIQR